MEGGCHVRELLVRILDGQKIFLAKNLISHGGFEVDLRWIMGQSPPSSGNISKLLLYVIFTRLKFKKNYKINYFSFDASPPPTLLNDLWICSTGTIATPRTLYTTSP